MQLVLNIVPIALSWVRCNATLSHPRAHINSELCYIAPHDVGWYYAQGGELVIIGYIINPGANRGKKISSCQCSVRPMPFVALPRHGCQIETPGVQNNQHGNAAFI